MPYPTEHSARLKDPKRYARFRRQNDKFGTGIHAIWGITAAGKVELQAIRFDAAKFTVARAKAWLQEHGYKPIRFEPAAPRKSNSAAKPNTESKGRYTCECLDCGERLQTDRHCRDVRCPKCGGEMRRAERPGPGNRTGESAMASRKERKARQALRRQEQELRKIIGDAPAEFTIQCEDAGPVEFLDVEAAADDGAPKLKRFKMTAYTGGALRLAGWPFPVVVDLAGMKSRGARPVFKDHLRSQVIGHTDQVAITSNRIHVEGVISGTSPAAREVVDTSGNGFPWQSSLGADVMPPVGRIVFVEAGETAEANGRTFTGPCFVARGSTLKEISFVALGADDNATAKVAASAISLSEDRTMKPFDEWIKAMGLDPATITDEQRSQLKAAYDKLVEAEAETEDPPEAPPVPPPPANAAAAPATGQEDPLQTAKVQLRAEHLRLNAIDAFSAEAFPGIKPEKMAEIKAKAINEDWTADKTELALLRASRPHAPSVAGFGRFEAEGDRRTVLCAALAMSGGMPDARRVEAYGEPACEQADDLRGIGIQEFLVLAAAAGGVDPGSIPRFRSDAQGFLRAAFSTVSVPYILGATANKLLLEGYNAVDQSWRLIAKVRPVKDFKQHTRHRLTADAKYQKLGPMGEIKHGVLDEQRFTQQIDTRARMFGITRQDIVNDDLGVFDTLRSVLGMGAADAINDVFWTLFLSNPSSFFGTAHGNYLTGASYTLGVDGLDALEQLILAQTKPAVGAETKPMPLGLQPKVLLVPHQLGGSARVLHKSTEIRNTTASTKYPVANVYAGKYGEEDRTLCISPFIGNSSFTGYSTTAFYIFVDPEVLAAVEVAFLNGKDAPTVESADADFNTLGIQLRGYHDFGVAMQDYRAAAKSKGAA
ncbi:MAG TPA: hypothetical protein VMW52_01920 [Phycisphaerae bacterium]|nr:hypothetical protein [Phycisphaerae bacterium]